MVEDMCTSQNDVAPRLGMRLISACAVPFASAFGAAGSIVVILVWIYYSSLLVFLGAEFTEVYARRRREGGKRISAEESAARTGMAMGVPALAGVPVAPRKKGGKVAPVMTGCAGLLVGLILGIFSAVVGVFITAIRSALKKMR